VAVLDAIAQICAGRPARHRIRFVMNLPSGSPLWRYVAEIAGATGDWWIERPDHTDRSLVDDAARLQQACPPPPLTDLAPAIVAADGSVRGKDAGFGWLAASGDYGLAGYRCSPRRVGTQPVLVAELCAIGDAVCGLPRRHLTVLSDSQDAIAMARRWMHGDPVMPAGYPAETGPDRALHVFRRRTYADRDRIELRWVRGHRGEPLNEGADALARLASRYRRGDRDLDENEYRRRAVGIATGFVTEFRRVREVSA
jgi:ribonuclease HI